MREGQIKKTYRAVVLGPPPDFGEINLPLSKDEKNNVVRVDEVAQYMYRQRAKHGFRMHHRYAVGK